MIASLPMYDRPENRAAHDVFWSLIRDDLRARGVEAPDALDREVAHMDGWGRPDLVLGQICNLPWRARFRDKVTLIGASDYGVPDCAPGHYYSLFVVRRDDDGTDPADWADRRFAYSEGLSNSGWGAPQAWAATRGFAFRPSLATGAHGESLRAVAEGRADIAAIDAVTWRMLEAVEPEAAAVRVVGRTGASPGQSFITAAGRDPDLYRAAIATAIAVLPAAEAAILGLRGVVVLPASDYELPLPPVPEAVAT